jgi:predicted transcriptional regulator
MIELPTPETDALFCKHGYPVEVETSKAMLLCEKLEQEKDWITEQFKCLKGAYSRLDRECAEAKTEIEKLELALSEILQVNENTPVLCYQKMEDIAKAALKEGVK